MSCFTYEHRGPGPAPPPVFPTRLLRSRVGDLETLAEDLRADEDRMGLPATRMVDPGFVAIAHGWAAGEALADVLGDEDLSGGDFVRNVKTLLDLVRQVGDVAPDPATARAARQAAEALHRGVISISSTLDEIVADAPPAGAPPDGPGWRRRRRAGRGARALGGTRPRTAHRDRTRRRARRGGRGAGE